MDKEIKGKVLVVTGGAEGIGFQIAKHFLKQQAKLAIIVDINEEQGNNAIEKLNRQFGENKSVYIKCDVAKDLEKTFKIICEKYHKVDVLVNNAGAVDESPETAENCIAVNLTAPIKWSYFVEHMKEGGTIINISSIFGLNAKWYCAVYHATKFGVIGFTKSLGHTKNYNDNKTRVIALCPGFTRTNITKGIFESDNEMCVEIRKEFKWQDAEVVGATAVEVFQTAVSGSVWRIEGGVLEEVK